METAPYDRQAAIDEIMSLEATISSLKFRIKGLDKQIDALISIIASLTNPNNAYSVKKETRALGKEAESIAKTEYADTKIISEVPEVLQKEIKSNSNSFVDLAKRKTAAINAIYDEYMIKNFIRNE